MKLLRTNDGMIGIVTKETPVKWFVDIQPATHYMWMHYHRLGNHKPEWEEMKSEVGMAIRHMIKENHTKAEFGVFGGFIFSTKEEE